MIGRAIVRVFRVSYANQCEGSLWLLLPSRPHAPLSAQRQAQVRGASARRKWPNTSAISGISFLFALKGYCFYFAVHLEHLD